MTYMSEETNPPEETVQFRVKEQSRQTKQAQVTLQELLDALKSAQDDIGQISESTSEEETLVAEFFASLFKLMQPFARTMPVSTTSLPEELGDVVRAHIDPTGHLMILYRDGEMELKDLSEEKNRDLMISVLEDIMPKFTRLFSTHRRKIEDRMKFLSLITKELQKMSKAFSKATT
jgi:hypothetical protein